MSVPATAFERLRSLQYLLFLFYFALVFKSFFRLVSFLPANFASTLDQTKYYLLRYLRIFLTTATLLVTNSEVLDAFVALGFMLIAFGIGRRFLRRCHFGFDSLAEALVFGGGLGLLVLGATAFLLRLLGQLYANVFYWTLGIALLLGGREIVTLIRDLWRTSWLAPLQKREGSWTTHLIGLFLMSYLFMFLAVAFV